MWDWLKKNWLWSIVIALIAVGATLFFCNGGPGFCGFLNANPLLVLLAMGLLATLVWEALARNKNASSWKPEARDIALIAITLAYALAGGFYLASALRHLAAPASANSAARVATLWAAAYCAAGFFVGFLFGIPRVLQKSNPDDQNGDAKAYLQRVNTNLEQISDWLTKIIVGLGLVQLRRIPDYLGRAAEWMAQSFTPIDGAKLSQIASVSNSIIIFFSIVGFLAGYLTTRLYLSGAFRRADQAGAAGRSDDGISKDDNTQKLRKFWMPDGKNADKDNEKKLLDWMKSENLSVPIPSFLNFPEYTQQREKAVKFLNIQ